MNKPDFTGLGDPVKREADPAPAPVAPSPNPMAHLNAMNGLLVLAVPKVRGETVYQMRGTVPPEWSIE
jgi:hypothetical protein